MNLILDTQKESRHFMSQQKDKKKRATKRRRQIYQSQSKCFRTSASVKTNIKCKKNILHLQSIQHKALKQSMIKCG